MKISILVDYFDTSRRRATTKAGVGSYGRCTAQFIIGEYHLLRNEPAPAKAALEDAAKTCSPLNIERAAARAELKRLPP